MTFRILFQIDRPLKTRRFVHVEVYPTASAMRSVLDTSPEVLLEGGPKTGKAVALTEDLPGALFAKVSLCEDHLDAATIVHECSHVVDTWQERTGIKDPEARAYGIEKLFKKIVKGIINRGGKVDLL